MNWEQEHKKRIEANVKKIDLIYQMAATEAAQIGASIKNFNPDKPFSFDDYPKTKYRIDKLLKTLATQVTSVIATGSKLEWDQANLKNDELVKGILGLKSDEDKEKNPVIKKFFNNNEAARDAFIARKTKGLNLSDKVWKYTDQFKGNIEMALDDGIRSGQPAAKMARDIKQFLVEPDRVYKRFQMYLKNADGSYALDKNGNKILIKQERRRYIDKDGKVTWRVESEKYKPGQGVYRSSRKNAERLTRTENNMAYRTSDHVRMQQLDFIVGQEIKLSKAHVIYDICDHLKGKYPKEYRFVGWHTQCFCYRVFILKTPDEMAVDTKKILAGEEITEQSVNLVKSVPNSYTNWIAANKDRIKNSKNIPYFIQDNHIDGDIGKGMSFVSIQEQKAVIAAKKAKEQNDIIQAAIKKEAEKALALKKAQEEALALKKAQEEAALKAEQEAQAKQKEQEQETKLSTLLVDVKALKAQFGIDEVQKIYTAVETKLSTWEGLTLEQQKLKLQFEIEWVEKNKKYDTWKAAQDAYKKKLSAVDYLLEKEAVQSSVKIAIEFSVKSKSAIVKQMASEIQSLLDKNAPIETIKDKAKALNTKVSKLIVEKEAKKAKKLLKGIDVDWNDQAMYAKARKDAAMWSKSVDEADKNVRDLCGAVWRSATVAERDAAFYYTHTFSSINEPLRGIPYYGVKDLALSQSKVPHLTSIIDKSAYDFDMWVQRGVGTSGFRGVFGVDLDGLNPSELTSALVGKTGVEKGFSSCGIAKGKGFTHQEVIYNIYCPGGTKMLYLEPFSMFGQGARSAAWDGISTQSAFGDEAEILIQRNTTFRITKAEYKSGKYYVDVEIIGQ